MTPPGVVAPVDLTSTATGTGFPVPNRGVHTAQCALGSLHCCV